MASSERSRPRADRLRSAIRKREGAASGNTSVSDSSADSGIARRTARWTTTSTTVDTAAIPIQRATRSPKGSGTGSLRLSHIATRNDATIGSANATRRTPNANQRRSRQRRGASGSGDATGRRGAAGCRWRPLVARRPTARGNPIRDRTLRRSGGAVTLRSHRTTLARVDATALSGCRRRRSARRGGRARARRQPRCARSRPARCPPSARGAGAGWHGSAVPGACDRTAR